MENVIRKIVIKIRTESTRRLFQGIKLFTACVLNYMVIVAVFINVVGRKRVVEICRRTAIMKTKDCSVHVLICLVERNLMVLQKHCSVT